MSKNPTAKQAQDMFDKCLRMQAQADKMTNEWRRITGQIPYDHDGTQCGLVAEYMSAVSGSLEMVLQELDAICTDLDASDAMTETTH